MGREAAKCYLARAGLEFSALILLPVTTTVTLPLLEEHFLFTPSVYRLVRAYFAKTQSCVLARRNHELASTFPFIAQEAVASPIVAPLVPNAYPSSLGTCEAIGKLF